MGKFFVAASLLGLLAPTPAAAQNIQQACQVKTLCAGVQPGGGRIMQCLHDHMSELSTDCFAAIGRMRLSRVGAAGAMAPNAQPAAPAAPTNQGDKSANPSNNMDEQ
jgi:hypothetical protein